MDRKAKMSLYQTVFGTDEGKKVLKDLEAVCGFKSVSFDENPYRTAYHEGMRAVYLYILWMIEGEDEEDLKREVRYGGFEDAGA